MKKSVNDHAFKHLVLDNLVLENTKDRWFEELKTNEYLLHNKSTPLPKIIFSLRSQLDGVGPVDNRPSTD